MNSYRHLSKNELLALIQTRDNELRTCQKGVSIDLGNFKRVISDVLVLLFNSTEQNPIEKAMQKLLNFFEADWGYVGIFEKGGRVVDFPCEVTNPLCNTPKDDRSELSYETMPWIVDSVKAGKDIVLSNIDDLPDEAGADRQLLRMQQLKSMLIIPLTFHNQIQGFIGFDSIRVQRSWTTQEIEDIHIIANIFSVIIERWQTKNSLEESRQRLSELSTKFKSFFEELPLGVELYDADGKMIDNNKADTAIFGCKREELLGVNLFDNPNMTDEIYSYIRNNKEYSFSLIYKFNRVKRYKYFNTFLENKVKHLQIKGRRLTDPEFGNIGYLFIISDNTENTLKAEQTENNLATLKAVLLNRKSVVGEFDTEKKELFFDRVLNDSRQNAQMFNHLWGHNHISLKELMEVSIFGEGPSDNFDYFRQIVAGKSTSCSITFHTKLENEVKWFRMNAQASKIKDNGIPGKIICYITNITSERKLQQQLIHAQNESRQAELEMQKAREADLLKSAFLANMSHEIRTPLNAIVGFSSIMAETEDPGERCNYMDIVNKNNDLLLRLITDILDFSKIESGSLDYAFTNINIKEICADQYIIHSRKKPENVQVICPLDTLPDYTIHSDYKRVMQVISNLLSNAFKFTSSGSITLSYALDSDERFLRIEVADTGIGIAEEDRKTIFERFVKVNNFKQGTGLGLCICETIVEALGGEIGVESEPGVGSTFWFTLPFGQ